MIDIDISDTDVYTDIDMDIDKDMIQLRNYTLLCNSNSQHIKLNTLSYFGFFNLSTRKIFHSEMEIKPVLSNGVRVPICMLIKDINCDTKQLSGLYSPFLLLQDIACMCHFHCSNLFHYDASSQ